MTDTNDHLPRRTPRVPPAAFVVGLLLGTAAVGAVTLVLAAGIVVAALLLAPPAVTRPEVAHRPAEAAVGPAERGSPSTTKQQDTAIAALPVAEEKPRLQYAWRPDVPYKYRARIRAEEFGESISFEGVVTYKWNPKASRRQARLREGVSTELGSGTAFVVHRDGLLVTCAHVVRGASKVKVALGEKSYPGDVVARDERQDVALIRIPAVNLPALPLAASDQPPLGEEVRAIGFPLSDLLGDTLKITRGSVSGFVTRREESLLQIDATLNPGNSGGPIVNNQGEVLGVASSGLYREGISKVFFATPARHVREMLSGKGLALNGQTSGKSFDGPGLAAFAAPSVALVTVDSRGGPPLQLLEYESYSWISSSGERPSQYAAFNNKPNERATVLLSAAGEIVECDARDEFPLLMTRLAEVALERLPGNEEPAWESRRVRGVTLEDIPNAGSMPAWELVRYKIVAETEEEVEIDKSTEVLSLDPEGLGGKFQVVGSGKMIWSKRHGVPISLKQSLRMTTSTGLLSRSLPLSLEVVLLEPGTGAGK